MVPYVLKQRICWLDNLLTRHYQHFIARSARRKEFIEEAIGILWSFFFPSTFQRNLFYFDGKQILIYFLFYWPNHILTMGVYIRVKIPFLISFKFSVLSVHTTCSRYLKETNNNNVREQNMCQNFPGKTYLPLICNSTVLLPMSHSKLDRRKGKK